MTVARTPPFVCPDPRAFEASAWSKDGTQQLEDGMLLPTWDPGAQLTVFRTIQSNVGLAMNTGKILPGTRLAFVPTWWSPGTGLRGKGAEAVFSAEATSQKHFDISMVMPGDQLKGSVQLRTSLVLLERPSKASTDPLAASRPGSVLWHDELLLVLEGEAPRFPATAVEFSKNNLGGATACWRLEWSPRELEAPAMACLRLWINKENEVFYRAMVAAVPTPEEGAMRSALRFCVAEEMLQLALEYADDLEQGTFDYGSSGRVFSDLVEQQFPGWGPRKTRQFRKKDPAAFSTRLQSGTHLFADIPAGSPI